MLLAPLAAAVVGVAALPGSVGAAPQAGAVTPANHFAKTNLIANNSTFGAKLVDPNLTNPWGLAVGPSFPIWVSDNNSGKASVYSESSTGKVTLDLTVPVPGGNPTGQVFNTTSTLPPSRQAFPVGGPTGSPADFIVSSDSIGSTQSPGEIAAWSGQAHFVVEDSPTGGPGGTTRAGAVFKGLALATTPTAGPELFAADVANARVDVFDRDFKPLATPGEFVDPSLPAGYAPFGVQVLDGKVFVTYGKQNATKTNVVRGPGLGLVDVFSVNGVFLQRLVSNGAAGGLDEPWGLAIAPTGFGPFAGKLLVGNLGNGEIDVVGPTSGAHLGTLDNAAGQPIVLPGLWGLSAGNSVFGGTRSVVFSAGPDGYSNGLVGVLNPTS